MLLEKEDELNGAQNLSQRPADLLTHYFSCTGTNESLGPIGNVCDDLGPDGDSAMTVGTMSLSVKPATTVPPTMIRMPREARERAAR